MIFYLGTHHPHWLAQTDVPLFISRNRLAGRQSFPVARGRWALDSGGFTELKDHGYWRFEPRQYVEEIRRFSEAIGEPDWVAPMDWMCEPNILAKTGGSVAVHQQLTVENFLALREQLGSLVIPVLQGWTLDEYHLCWGLYEHHGIDLANEPLVGVGSICRRGQDDEIVRILHSLRPLRMHAFGVRTDALMRCAHFLASADSMAWSARGRRIARRPGCDHPRDGKTEANCLRFALDWRDRQPALNRIRLELAV